MNLTKYWTYVLIVVLLAVAVIEAGHNNPPPKPIVKTCPHYVTVKSISSSYSGAWAGTVVTITMEDGSSYQSNHHRVTNYVGQKICSTDLDKL